MKIKIFLFSIFVSTLCFTGLKAQDISYGLFAGPSTRNISYGSGNVFSHPDIGGDFGLLTEFRFSENFSLQPEIEYSGQGSKNGKFISSINYDENTYPGSSKFAELNYLMIPVLAKFGWHIGDRYKSHFRFYINAGPYAGILLSANQLLLNNLEKVPGSIVNIKPELNNFNAGIDGSLGVNYSFPASSIFIQAGGNYGLMKIQRDISNGGNYAGAASITVGYTVWIDNNFLNSDHVAPLN